MDGVRWVACRRSVHSNSHLSIGVNPRGPFRGSDFTNWLRGSNSLARPPPLRHFICNVDRSAREPHIKSAPPHASKYGRPEGLSSQDSYAYERPSDSGRRT